MKRLVASISLGLLLLASVASAQMMTSGFCGVARVQTPPASTITSGAAYQQLIVSTSVVTPTIPTLSRGSVVGAVVQILLGLINEKHDGNTPNMETGPGTVTATTGGATWGPGGTTVSATPTVLTVCGSDLVNLKMIQSSQSSTPSTVNIYYYTQGS